MRFLAGHPLLFALAVACGMTFAEWLRRRPPRFGVKAAPLVAMTTAFVIWGYFLHPTYVPYMNVGVAGDFYAFMNAIARDPFPMHVHHMSFPYLGGLSTRALEAIGALDRASPRYWEDVVLWSSLLTRLASVASLVFWAWVATRAWGGVRAGLSTLILASSYAFWAWGTQANGLGFMLACELASAAFFLNWTRTGKLADWIGVAIFLCLAVYSHVASIFFAFGSFAFLTYWAARHGGARRAKLLGSLAITCASLGAAFWAAAALSLEAKGLPGMWEPSKLISHLSDPGMLGKPKVDPMSLIRAAKDNLVTGLMNVVNYWDPRATQDLPLTFLQIASLAALLALAFRGRKEIAASPLLAWSLATSAAIFVAFLLRSAGTHYYATAAVPNLVLLVAVALPANPGGLDRQRETTLAAFALACALYSGFSSWSVLRGGSLDQMDYYRVSRALEEKLPSGRRAIVVSDFRAEYVTSAASSYFRDRFPTIEWFRADLSRGAESLRVQAESLAGKGDLYSDDTLDARWPELASIFSVTATGPEVRRIERIGAGK